MLAGLFVTPLFITAFLLVDATATDDTRIEANTWVGASADIANGAVTIGALVSAQRWDTALLLLSACATAGVITALLTPIPAPSTESPDTTGEHAPTTSGTALPGRRPARPRGGRTARHTPVTGPPPCPAVALSPAEARHLAVTAALPPGGLPGPAAVLEHLRIVQIDAISTLARAHHLTLATRIRGATTTAVDTALAQEPRPAAFDYPAHALSLVPVTDWPWWAFRRRAVRRHPQYPEAALRATSLQHIAHHGPSPLRALRRPGEVGGGWGWGPTKTAVEILGWAGELACTPHRRRTQTVRPARPLHPRPPAHRPGHRRRMPPHPPRTRGARTRRGHSRRPRRLPPHPPTNRHPAPAQHPLVPATVGPWDKPAWAHPAALTPPGEPRPQPALFLGPFDNLLWHRPRARRLFTFTHLFEAYKPADRRTHGYYVCPLLADRRLIGRADLTRHDNALTVLHASFEDHARPDAHSHFADACHHMATLTTHTLIADDAAEPALVKALRTALTEHVTP